MFYSYNFLAHTYLPKGKEDFNWKIDVYKELLSTQLSYSLCDSVPGNSKLV